MIRKGTEPVPLAEVLAGLGAVDVLTLAALGGPRDWLAAWRAFAAVLKPSAAVLLAGGAATPRRPALPGPRLLVQVLGRAGRYALAEVAGLPPPLDGLVAVAAVTPLGFGPPPKPAPSAGLGDSEGES
jgi:hypothetical protein